MKPQIFFAVLTTFALTLFPACKAQHAPQTEFVLGTVCTVNLYEKGTDRLYAEIFSRLRGLESILSANRDDSNIAAINAGAGHIAVAAAPETLTVLAEALEFSAKTGGAFDPSVGPLVALWNIGTDYAAVPSPDRIQAALALIDYRNIALDAKQGTVFLAEEGMRLDLGGIAKGYAADEIVKILSAHGVKRAIVDLGGNIYAYGEKKRGTAWVIGIRDPEIGHDEAILSIPVKNESVVTSGIYERYFEENGKRYHHILDTKTGYPADNELMSVSIIASESIRADALSTSAFLLGTEKGLALIEQTENTDAVFINKNHEIRISSGLNGNVKILNDGYRLVD